MAAAQHSGPGHKLGTRNTGLGDYNAQIQVQQPFTGFSSPTFSKGEKPTPNVPNSPQNLGQHSSRTTISEVSSSKKSGNGEESRAGSGDREEKAGLPKAKGKESANSRVEEPHQNSGPPLGGAHFGDFVLEDSPSRDPPSPAGRGSPRRQDLTPKDLDSPFVAQQLENWGRVMYSFDLEDHVATLTFNLRELRAGQIMTDVVWMDNARNEIRLHSVMLAAISQVFYPIYTQSDPHKLQLFSTKFSLPLATRQVMKTLVHYIYGLDPLTDDVPNIWQEVIDVASYLGFESIVNGQYGAEYLLNGLKELYDNSHLSYTGLLTRDGEVVCNAAILAASSPAFLNSLVPEFMPPATHRVQLPNITSAAMETILEYIYSAKVIINSSSVQDLLLAACHLHYPALGKACCHFILKIMAVPNVVGIVNFGRQTYAIRQDGFCRDMVERATRFIINNFGGIVISPQFVMIQTADEIVEYMSRANMADIKEQDVSAAIWNWYLADIDGRHEGMLRAITCLCTLKKINGFLKTLQNISKFQSVNNPSELFKKLKDKEGKEGNRNSQREDVGQVNKAKQEKKK